MLLTSRACDASYLRPLFKIWIVSEAFFYLFSEGMTEMSLCKDPPLCGSYVILST